VIRNRSAYTRAMLRRAHVAGVLAERSAFEPISDKQIARLLDEPTSYRAIAAARRWLEKEFARDKLAVLRNWIRERRGKQ
jgi:hypothetical protein